MPVWGGFFPIHDCDCGCGCDCGCCHCCYLNSNLNCAMMIAAPAYAERSPENLRWTGWIASAATVRQRLQLVEEQAAGSASRADDAVNRVSLTGGGGAAVTGNLGDGELENASLGADEVESDLDCGSSSLWDDATTHVGQSDCESASGSAVSAWAICLACGCGCGFGCGFGYAAGQSGKTRFADETDQRGQVQIAEMPR